MPTKPSRAKIMAKTLKVRTAELVELGALTSECAQPTPPDKPAEKLDTPEQLAKRQAALKRLRSFID